MVRHRVDGRGIGPPAHNHLAKTPKPPHNRRDRLIENSRVRFGRERGKVDEEIAEYCTALDPQRTPRETPSRPVVAIDFASLLLWRGDGR